MLNQVTAGVAQWIEQQTGVLRSRVRFPALINISSQVYLLNIFICIISVRTFIIYFQFHCHPSFLFVFYKSSLYLNPMLCLLSSLAGLKKFAKICWIYNVLLFKKNLCVFQSIFKMLSFDSKTANLFIIWKRNPIHICRRVLKHCHNGINNFIYRMQSYIRN